VTSELGWGALTLDRACENGSVLAIEDDPDVRDLLGSRLRRAGYLVHLAATGREGLRTFHQARPDVVVLDLSLPDLDGWDVLARIRELSDAPVLVLTGRAAESDKVRGLDAGADDYLTKPFGLDELLARLRALRRRARPGPSVAGVDDGHLHLDFVRKHALVGGEPVDLTPLEYRLLSAFVQHPGEVLDPHRLVELAWGVPAGSGAARVKYAVLRLRRKLGWEPESSPLRTVRGFGYRYDPDAEDRADADGGAAAEGRADADGGAGAE